MKLALILLIATLLLFALAIPAMAQDELPDSAVGFLAILQGWIPALTVFAVGYVGSKITGWLKLLPWLNAVERTTIHKMATEWVSMAVPAVLGLALVRLDPLAVGLDKLGIWPVIISIYAMGKITYWLDSFKKTKVATP